MSAWIVSKQHIDLLVAASKEVVPDVLGQMLWDENHKSVNYRYTETKPTPSYTFTARPNKVINPVVVLKQLACYEYQSCEHAGWEDSKAYKFCQMLKAELLATFSTPMTEEMVCALPEYNAAPWGVGND